MLSVNDRKKLKNIFAAFKVIKAAYLFGSFAEGRANTLSDFDFGVLLEEGYQSQIKLDILAALAENDFCRVDLVVLNEADLLLRFEVVKHNEILYRREDFDASGYFSRVIREYLDFKPFLEVQRMYLKRNLRGARPGG